MKSQEKEWISPPVTPRAVVVPPPDIEEEEVHADPDYDFDGAYLEWSY